MDNCDQSWEAFGILSWLIRGLNHIGVSRTTPVQRAVTALINKDVVVEAPTGSGKTLAFLVPLICRLLLLDQPQRHHYQALILAPTRELANQIYAVLLSLLHCYTPEDCSQDRSCLSPQLVTGGNVKSLAQDLSDFHSNSPNIIIGTPGRVNKLLSSGSIRSSQVELVILDEADRLLDSKFNEEISSILTILPKQRRTGLFSASMSEASLSQLFYAGLRNPVRISLKSKGYGTEMRTPRSLELKYIVARPTHQLSLIRKLLEKFKPFRTIIFFPT